MEYEFIVCRQGRWQHLMVCKTYDMGVEEVEKLYESSYCLKGVLKAKHTADAVLFLVPRILSL